MIESLCLFCGSNLGTRPEYVYAARLVGETLGQRGITLVYGGSNVGLMGTAADACLDAGGRVIGVIPKALVDREVAHTEITELRVVNTMHERKALMADLADAFLALPGGFGTWDEFCEMLTWAMLGIQQKPCGMLNIAGYYDPFLALADRAVQEGFLQSAHRKLLLSDSDPQRLLNRLGAYEMPEVVQWADRAAR